MTPAASTHASQDHVEVPALGPHDVHVWRVRLDDPGWPVDALTDVLSPEERLHAGTFAFGRDRRRTEVRRGVLRLLLAGYLGLPAGAVDFRYGPMGKPELALPSGDPPVAFSCSHSQGLALHAFALGRRVGVDVEAVRGLPEAAGIAELCFTRRERSALAALPHAGLEAAVLRGWTMKEAYTKAVGDGLTMPLDRIEVSASGGCPELLAIDGDPAVAARWSVQALTPQAGFLAGLVVEGHGYQLRLLMADPGG